MSFKSYLRDRILPIVVFVLVSIMVAGILWAFGNGIEIIIIILCLNLIPGLFGILFMYLKKRKFYVEFDNILKELDQKYLITEMPIEPKTYEDAVLFDALQEINRSMLETVNEKERNIKDYKEFIEIWIHEVKIPISSLVLKCHNNPGPFSKELLAEVRRLENYVDTVLYYTRSENAEKDFLITKTNLKDIVRSVLIRNKDDLLASNFEIENQVEDVMIHTDTKWIEFILNQIVSNSIKYKNGNPKLSFLSKVEDDRITLSIKDNGIGIMDKDLGRVFEKSFTGENGRMNVKSTGMGLYIVKNLCDKLGHSIEIESKINEYTEIFIHFGVNEHYQV